MIGNEYDFSQVQLSKVVSLFSDMICIFKKSYAFLFRECHWRCKCAHFRRDKNAQLTTFKQVFEGSGDAENGGLSDARKSPPLGDGHQSNLPGNRV